MQFSGFHAVILIVALVIVAAILILFVSAIVSIAKSEVSGTEKAVWVLVALCFPILGPLIWFFMRGASGSRSSN